MFFGRRDQLKFEIAAIMLRRAKLETFDGIDQRVCERNKCNHLGSGTILIFTRDVGYHTSGWWKNPDFERCLHLSLSFYDLETRERAPKNRKLTAEWVGLFFGKDKDKLWCEPPYSAQGKKDDVWHYRLFCDAGWQPIVPRGEVYSKELTEAGWQSYSDVQETERVAREEARHGR